MVLNRFTNIDKKLNKIRIFDGLHGHYRLSDQTDLIPIYTSAQVSRGLLDTKIYTVL